MMIVMMMLMTMMIMMCLLHPKGSQTKSAPGGWEGAINYADDDDENSDDDDDDNSDVEAKFRPA